MSDLQAHPYANAWPMMPDDEIAELAEDIATNGLREPIVIYDGMILDGRNRAAACEVACVEPTSREMDGDDDAALAFVQSVNNERRHQSKGSRAASWALSMLAADKRDGGRWAYGAANSQNSDYSNETRRVLGIIADHAPELLYQVRDDDLSLNKAYEESCRVRDADLQRLEAEQREAVEEAEAKTFLEENDAALAARVDGKDLLTFREALDLWNRRNAEEAARIRAEKDAKAKAKRERDSALSHTYTRIATFLQIAATYGANDDPAAIMSDYSKRHLDPPQLERWFTATEIVNARRFLDALTEWSK